MIFIIVNNKEVYGIIYKVTNKINNMSYIGQTKSKQGFRGRYKSKAESNSERLFKYLERFKRVGGYYNVSLYEDMVKYGYENFEVTEVLDYAETQDELNDKEIKYIKEYDSFNNGYNNNTGGGFKGNKHGADPKNPLYNIPIYQLSLDGKIIKEWDSLMDVASSGLNTPNIVLTCKGVNSQSYGCLWIFKKDYNPSKNYCWKPSNNYKAVLLLDNDGNIIDEYISIDSASKKLKLDRTTVRDSCNGRWKNPKYNLRFKKDYEYAGEQRLNE